VIGGDIYLGGPYEMLDTGVSLVQRCRRSDVSSGRGGSRRTGEQGAGSSLPPYRWKGRALGGPPYPACFFNLSAFIDRNSLRARRTLLPR